MKLNEMGIKKGIKIYMPLEKIYMPLEKNRLMPLVKNKLYIFYAFRF